MAVDNYKEVDFNKIAQLPHDMEPQWGSMRLQHMIEHLADVFSIGNGGRRVNVITPTDKVEKTKAVFLMSDRELPKDFKTPLLPDSPPPYRYANMQEAIEVLKNEMLKFEEYHKANPEAKECHPVFGPLNYSEWIHFHNKHFTHHFKQFNLI